MGRVCLLDLCVRETSADAGGQAASVIDEGAGGAGGTSGGFGGSTTSGGLAGAAGSTTLPREILDAAPDGSQGAGAS